MIYRWQFSAATPIEASRASGKASATSVVQSVLAFTHHAKAFFSLSGLARCPEILPRRAGKIVIACCDCAQLLRAES